MAWIKSSASLHAFSGPSFLVRFRGLNIKHLQVSHPPFEVSLEDFLNDSSYCPNKKNMYYQEHKKKDKWIK